VSYIQDLLGTTSIRHTLTRMEIDMAKIIDSLRALAEQTNQVSAAQATSFSNLQNAVARLEQAVRDGEVSPEVQAAVDELSASLTRLGDDARRADDGFEPAPVEPTPAPVEGETPVDPTIPQPTER
jgi:hypothetical protein